MVDEIPEPNLAPPTPNVIYDVTPPVSDVIQPTPEEIATYNKVVGPPPAPAFNPIKELTAQELADLSVKDKAFDIASAFRASADLHGDPAIVQKSADALNLVKQRGFKLADLPSLPEAGKAVLHTAKGFGKQLWNYANAAGGIVQTAIADVVGNPEFSAASANEVNRRLAGNIAGTEEAVTGLTQLGEKALGKAGRALGITTAHADKTPEERVADLWSDVGKSEVQQQRLTGQGPFTQTVTAGTSAKANLNPEEVATLAAGDPFSFYLFGAAGKLAGAAVPLAARTAISAGTTAATEAAGRVAQVVGGKAAQGVGKAVGGTAGLVEAAAPVVSPIAGAVKGGTLYGPAGVAGGFVAGERAGKILAGGARRVGAVADNLADLGKQIASSAPVKSAYAQAGRDFLQALPGATFEAAKGAALDLGLAAASAETPGETQGAAAFGTVLGGLHGAAKIGGRVISGQLIAPREYGISTPQPSSGMFPSLDALHQQGFQQATPAVKARLNAMRQFAKGAADTDVFYAPDSAGLRNALSEIGVNDAQANAYSQHQGFFTTSLPGKDGSSRRIVVVTAPEAAPHESFHAIQDVIGETGNQQIDQIVREAYADQWDTRGTDYATRLAGGDLAGKTWQETINDSTGEGMAAAKEKVFQQIYNSIEGQTGAAPSRALVESLAKESYGRIMDEAVAANPQIPHDQIALQVWREILSPEEAADVADTYIARELAAENFDAIFKHAGPTLTEGNTLPAKLARIAGRVMTVFGMNPLEGRVSTTIDVPLKEPVVEAVRQVSRGRLPEVSISPKGEKTSIGKVPAGTPAEEARTIADEAPTTPTEKGTMSQREMLGSVAEAIAARDGVKINYLSAPGEPAAATTSNRTARRAIIETFRDMPAAARSLWEKTFFPERVRKTQKGKYQVFGWAPEVFAANAHKMASFLTAHPELSPYAIDAATKSFTSEAWQELYRDTQTFVQNQKAGQTGSGEPLVVPKSVTDRGFTAPASRASDAVSIDQNKADFINLLFNAKLPETPRVQSGKLPLNLAGQQISEATLPGRVEVPVRPRGEYVGAEAERQGISGFNVAEVNPLRNRIEAAAQSTGKPMPSLIEANQMLNLENIKELEHAPEQPEFRANTLTLQAGFAPAVERALRDLPPVLEGAIRFYHGEGGPQGGGTGGSFYTTTPEKAATFGSRISYVDLPAERAQAAREAAKEVGQGGDTALLTRADIARSKELGADVPIVTYDLEASFAPKAAMEDLKNLSDEAWQEKINDFRGKNGGGLTGWAYDVGAEAKTPADLEAFRSTAALMSEATKAAMGAGQFDKAMQLAARAQAAGEAFEAATGTKLDGTAKDVAKFIREHSNPSFEYSMPAGDSKAGEPLNDVHAVAQDYATQAGIDYNPKRAFAKAPEALLKRVSDFYEKAVHAPTDPAVAKSYSALARETEAQYNSIVDAGYKLEPFTGAGEPYKTSADMVRDVRENKHLFYLETDKAYGAGAEVKNNLLLASSGVEINGKPVPVNDLFRAVHDFFGHAAEGYQFGPRGEFNAWKAHSEMFTPEAQGALAAETLAQNSFVNFGPHMRTAEGKIRQKGEPGFLAATERPFGEQKNVVVPPELLREAGAVRFAPKKTKDDLTLKTGAYQYSKAWILPDGKPVQLGGTWHHQWLSENPEITKKYGLDVPPFEGGESEGVRESALKKGFVRINYGKHNGELTVEARAKDWRNQKNTVQDLIERNLDTIDKVKVTLLDEKVEHVVDSQTASLFNLDTDAEKMAALPFISTGEIRGQFAPKSDAEQLAKLQASKKREARGGEYGFSSREQDQLESLTQSLGPKPEFKEEYSTRPEKTVPPKGLNKVTDEDRKYASAWVMSEGDAYEVRSANGRIYHDDAIKAFSEFYQDHEKDPNLIDTFQYEAGAMRVSNMDSPRQIDENGGGVGVSVSRKPTGGQLNYLRKLFDEINQGGDRAISSVGVDITDSKGDVIASKFFSLWGKNNVGEVIRFLNDPFSKGEEIKSAQFAPAKFEDDSFAASLKKIRSGQEAGQTFNTDGTVWNRGEAQVDLVPLASVNVPQGKLTPEAFREALAPYSDLLDEPTIKAGVFSFSQDGKPVVSIDINAVVPQEFRANSVEFAKANDQVAMWDAVKNENVETGGKGNTRLTKTNEIIDALDALTTGEKVDVNEIKRQYAETAGRAEEQVSLFAGGREYVGNAAVANMTKAQLADAFPEVIIPRRRTDPIPSEIVESPLFKQAGSEAKAVDAFARRLVEFSNEYRNDPAFQAGAKWYSEFVPKLKKEFGADAQVMAELLAATSPQTAVGVNFAYAFDALQSLKSGRFDKTIVKFKQGLDMMDNGKWLDWYNKENEAGNIPKPPKNPTLPAFLEAWINKHDLKPRQSNGALYGTHSIPVLQVFARKWLTESRGPKTLNFVKNLVGEGHEATIDLWADRTMRRVGYSGFRNRWRILPGNVQGVSAPDFAFAQKAFRKAAEELGMEPDALQGALWFAEKKLYHDKGWGRLDLGDFQAEMAKVPMMKAGYKQRVAAGKQRATEKPVETPELFTVEPRYKK